MLSVQSDGENFQESSRLDQAVSLSGRVAALLFQLGHQLAARSLSRSGEDGLLIPAGWFAVASHDRSDMLKTSGCN